jgi:hypothetical protein
MGREKNVNQSTSWKGDLPNADRCWHAEHAQLVDERLRQLEKELVLAASKRE